MTCDLPPVLKAEHYLALDLIRAAIPDTRHIFDVGGRGTHAAISTIKNALEEGYDWCWVGDVRDCFQSVSADALISRLPLPGPAVRHWLDYRNLNFSPEPIADDAASVSALYVSEDVRRNRPRGLLQGSPASNLALAMLFVSMAGVFDLHECVPCLFTDNLFVAAKTEVERDGIVAAIGAYLSAHPAGRFRLHKEKLVSPGEEFETLGWTFVRGEHDVHIEPTYAAQDRMFGKLAGADNDDVSRADGTIAATERIVNGYRGSFKPWTEAACLLEGAMLRAQDFVDVATAMRTEIDLANTRQRSASENRHR